MGAVTGKLRSPLTNVPLVSVAERQLVKNMAIAKQLVSLHDTTDAKTASGAAGPSRKRARVDPVNPFEEVARCIMRSSAGHSGAA